MPVLRRKGMAPSKDSTSHVMVTDSIPSLRPILMSVRFFPRSWQMTPMDKNASVPTPKGRADSP